MDDMEILHNCRVKRYPDGSADIIVASTPFGGGTVERRSREELSLESWHYAGLGDEFLYWLHERQGMEFEDTNGIDVEAEERRTAANRSRSQRRARVAVRDLGLSNDWRFFVTLTLSPERVNRYDPVEVLRHLKHWLDNQVRRKGLAYVLVPEHHKDGAIHFHGFFNDALRAVDSGHKDSGGHTVYNLPEWGWGFSTAIELYGERAAAVGYCVKYISKQQEKIGGRWYYSGGALRRPAVEWCDVDFEEFAGTEGAEPFTVDGLPWSRFVRLRTEGGEGSCGTGTAGAGNTELPLQDSCNVKPDGAESLAGDTVCEGDLTFSGLSITGRRPLAAPAAPEGAVRMTRKKRDVMEVEHDHRIPVEQGDRAHSRGP